MNNVTPRQIELPSVAMLSQLAAIMKKSPEDAMKLWLKAEELVFEHQMVNDHNEAVGKLYSLEEAMKMVGVHTPKTFFNLLASFMDKTVDDSERALMPPGHPITYQDCVDSIKQGRGITLGVIESAIAYRRKQNEERGRKNRLNVKHSKRRRKSVK